MIGSSARYRQLVEGGSQRSGLHGGEEGRRYASNVPIWSSMVWYRDLRMWNDEEKLVRHESDRENGS